MKKTNKDIKIKQGIIPELVSESSTLAVTQEITQRQALKTLNQVQGLTNLKNTRCVVGLRHCGRQNMQCIGAAPHLYPALQACGMTECVARKGFTLIELLVVVLIIGILAAIALPQYQQAVEKAQATQAITLLKSIQVAENMYYLTNGTYTTDLTKLDIKLDWPASTKKWWEHGTQARTNGEWVLEVFSFNGATAIVIGRISGRQQGGAFGLFLKPFSTTDKISVNQIYCAEKRCCGTVYKGKGYCQPLFGGTKIYHDGGGQWYSLPYK